MPACLRLLLLLLNLSICVESGLLIYIIFCLPAAAAAPPPSYTHVCVCVQNVRMWFIVGGVVAVIVMFIVLLACGWNFRSC